MDFYLLVGLLTLILQLAVFLLLVGGVMLKRMRLYRAHGFAMFTGVVLHLVTIGVVMIRSFVLALVPIIISSPSSAVSMLSSIHAALGTVSAVLGVWILGGWRFRRSLEFCAPKRRWMRATFWVWASSLVTGFVLFLLLFWTVLFG